MSLNGIVNRPGRWLFAGLMAALAAGPVAAQEETERLSSGIPLENRIAGRDLAFRWRWEVQDSEESMGPLDEDPTLARYPTRLYTSELKMFLENGVTAFVMVDQWENHQDLDVSRTSGGFGIPVEGWRVEGKAAYSAQGTYNDNQFYYLSLGRPLGAFYTYTQYRLSLEGQSDNSGYITSHQLNEYVSWTPVKTFRLGAQGGYCEKENRDDSGYIRVFSTRSFFNYRTALRVEALCYESRLNPDYREVKSYLYQKLTDSTLLRLGYRYYGDDDSQESHGPGVKLIHFFGPRIACHVGYLRYVSPDGPDFDSVLGGMNVIF
jgi:hypothetical protein